MESAAAAAQRKLQAQTEAAEGPPLLPVAGGPRGTLIVCPLSVLSNWQQQIQEHTAGNLKVSLQLCVCLHPRLLIRGFHASPSRACQGFPLLLRQLSMSGLERCGCLKAMGGSSYRQHRVYSTLLM